eukprot:Nitzschia sp. Nitz4//scaffold5_size260463//62373//63455//NITZ4_000958-RA/size260463-processed-gene-0.61-mRNA-1//1//CDS//3329555268//7116//frame0
MATTTKRKISNATATASDISDVEVGSFGSSWEEQELAATHVLDASVWSQFSVQRPLRVEDGDHPVQVFKAQLHEDDEDDQRDSDSACSQFTIKCVRRSLCVEELDSRAKELETELQIVKRLAHANIVHVEGMSSAFHSPDSTNYFVLYEALEETLHDLLERWRRHPVLPRRSPLLRLRVNKEREQIKSSLHRRVKFVANGVCKAAAFAHSKGVALQNLEPSTIGLDPYGNVKLFDFSKAVVNRDGYDGYRFASSIPVQSTKVVPMGHLFEKDVFDFGVVLWLVASLKPIPGGGRMGKVNAAGELSESVFLGKKPGFWDVPSARVQSLIEACWERNPDARPSFDRLKMMLVDRYNSLGYPL